MPDIPDAPSRQRPRWLRRFVIAALLAVPAWWLYRGVFPPRLRVSPETTVITSPLLPDGRPDYVAYLNAKHSVGVTPENNAVVLLMRVEGQVPLSPEDRESFFQQMGVPPHGDEDKWVNWDQFAEANGMDEWQTHAFKFNLLEGLDQLNPLHSPDVAEYMAANAAVYDMVHQALRREKFFYPRAEFTHQSGEVNDGFDGHFRGIQWMLQLRGVYSLRMGDVETALLDAIALMKLGRHLQAHGSWYSLLNGGSAERAGYGVISRMAAGNLLTREYRIRLERELAQLPPATHFADVLNEQIRFEKLDLASRLRTTGGLDISIHHVGYVHAQLPWGGDVNVLIKSINHDIDTLLAILRISDLREQNRQLVNWEERCEKIEEARKPISPMRERITGWLNRQPLYFISTQGDIALFASSIGAENSNTSVVTRLLLNAGLRVLEFRDEQGRLPNSLAELEDSVIARHFIDPWSAKPYIYELHENVFRLWSVGENGIDDGGWTFGDRKGDADDIRFGLKPEQPANSQSVPDSPDSQE